MGGTSQFQFRELSRTLNIEGHEFEVLVGDIEALSAGSELAERLKKVNIDKLGAAAYRKLSAEINAAVDQVLGEGACDTILAGRRATITGMVQLLGYVLSQVTADFGGEVERVIADFTTTVAED
jgi:hypothetical protein